MSDRPTTGEHVLKVAEQLVGELVDVDVLLGEHPLLRLLADGVALGGMERAVLGQLEGIGRGEGEERARRDPRA